LCSASCPLHQSQEALEERVVGYEVAIALANGNLYVSVASILEQPPMVGMKAIRLSEVPHAPWEPPLDVHRGDEVTALLHSIADA
jgi:hypothetical protein